MIIDKNSALFKTLYQQGYRMITVVIRHLGVKNETMGYSMRKWTRSIL